MLPGGTSGDGDTSSTTQPRDKWREPGQGMLSNPLRQSFESPSYPRALKHSSPCKIPAQLFLFQANTHLSTPRKPLPYQHHPPTFLLLLQFLICLCADIRQQSCRLPLWNLLPAPEQANHRNVAPPLTTSRKRARRRGANREVVFDMELRTRVVKISFWGWVGFVYWT